MHPASFFVRIKKWTFGKLLCYSDQSIKSIKYKLNKGGDFFEQCNEKAEKKDEKA